MAVAYVDIETEFVPQAGETPITVAVQIGNGQTGAYLVFLGRTLKGSNTLTDLGLPADLNGTYTLVAVTITDTLNETNWTSVTTVFTQGTNQKVLGPYNKEAANHLDTIVYTIKVTHG